MAHTSKKTKRKLNYQPSKLGRKGDPRMHNAVRARLEDPNLSPLDALTYGGFRFYTGSDGVTYDSENVTLTQRKNQLSRRIRVAKKQGLEPSDLGTSDGSEGKVKSGAKKNSTEFVSILKTADIPANQYSFPSFDPDSRTLSRASSLDPIVNGNMPMLDGINFAVTASSDNIFSNPFMNMSESQHMKMAHCPKKQRLSSFSIQAGNTNHDYDPRRTKAVDNFSIEVSALYKKSMLSAGYSMNDTDECDINYLKFTEAALQKELERIHRICKRVNVQSSSEFAENNHVPSSHIDNAHNYAHGHDHSHSHSHDHSHNHGHDDGKQGKDKDCMHSRHLHRLEGKCGHKAVVHKPPGGDPHIDFVVNDKIECYEGCNPMIDSTAFWPSKFSVEEAFNTTNIFNVDESSAHTKEQRELLKQQQQQQKDLLIQQAKAKQSCEDDQCKPPNYEPKTFDLKDIDMTGGEWSKLFDEDSKSNSSESDEAILGSLFSMQKR